MQIILAQSGAQYDYKVILSELLILIFLMVIGAIIISYRYRKCLKMFTKNEWDKIINSKKLIYVLRFKEKDLMIYILAISYFEKMDDQNFYYYINKLKNKEVINRKFFWIAIDALILGYIDEYWKWRTELIQSESSLNKEKYMIILDIAYKCCFENYRCTETEVSMINSLYSKRIYNVISY